MGSLVWLVLVGAVASLRCPDGRLCPGRDVCCRDPRGGGYACCPPALGSLPMTRTGSAAEPAGTVCPDGRQCPVEYSCLRTSAGSFGCCPLAEAVACADGRHCCPRGAHCSADGRSCFVLPGLPTAGAVQCPDGKSECPNDSTCCVMPTGAWGCCPMPQAVCCPDHVHCCPKGYTCDLARGSCHPPGASIPWLEKTPARLRAPSRERDVPCDEQTSCPDGNTCCRLSTGAWGCCPLVEAVCCPDHMHCCPKGYTCDGSSCQAPGASIPWLEKTPARLRAPSRERDVPCDEQTSCPDGNTCCRLSTGAWGCCPLVEAVCCPDHVHCCPKGYTCTPEGSCDQALLSLPWAPQVPARLVSAPPRRAVPCDQSTSCEDGQTCCKSETGAWACCNLPNAVCCEDHQHCCPWGYTCNLAAQSCEKQEPGWGLPGDLSPAASLLPASAEPSNDVACDAQHYCPDHQTCCKAPAGAWACCPYPWGSCCADQRHCCPWAYRCSPSGLDCKRWWPLRWDTRTPRPRPLL